MRLSRLLCAALSLGLAAGPAAATKLDKPICDDLKVEQGLLEQKGVASDKAKGADWGRSNLSRDRLKEIERLIHVEEQLAFRCPQPRKPAAPGEDDNGNVVATPAKPGAKSAQAKPPTVKPAKPKPKTAEAVGTPAAAPASKAATPAAAAPVAKKPQPKPKPKVEDAYSPPPASAAKPALQK